MYSTVASVHRTYEEPATLPAIEMEEPVESYDITDMSIWRTGGSLAVAESEQLAMRIRADFNPSVRAFQKLLQTDLKPDSLVQAGELLQNLVSYVDDLARVVHNIARQAPTTEWIATLSELQRLAGR